LLVRLTGTVRAGQAAFEEEIIYRFPVPEKSDSDESLVKDVTWRQKSAMVHVWGISKE